jgi:uncharacterized membrane protein YebE (DUF533 family)
MPIPDEASRLADRRGTRSLMLTVAALALSLFTVGLIALGVVGYKGHQNQEAARNPTPPATSTVGQSKSSETDQGKK